MSILTKLQNFAVYPHHIRPSAAAKLCACPASRVLSMDEVEDRPGGAAAQTGNLVHEAAAAFHNHDMTGGTPTQMTEAGLRASIAAIPKFPLGDVDEAQKVFAHYSKDPRNWVKVVAVEKKVDVHLPPHRLDPTGKTIYIKGTLDQIREEDGELNIYDIKTGAPDGLVMSSEHAMQQALYFLAARNCGYAVNKAFVIRTKAYRVRGAILPSPERLFWWVPLTADTVHDIIDKLRLEVAIIRSGEVNFGLGSHCIFCDHRSFTECRPKLADFLAR